MTSRTGLIVFCTRSERDIAMPIGMPITMERTVQTKIIDTVFIVSSHMSK